MTESHLEDREHDLDTEDRHFHGNTHERLLSVAIKRNEWVVLPPTAARAALTAQARPRVAKAAVRPGSPAETPAPVAGASATDLAANATLRDDRTAAGDTTG